MVVLMLVMFVAPFVALLFYSVPATDDFCKATFSFNGVPQHGVLSVTWMYYTNWSPRWFTTWLQSFVMSHVDLPASYGWLLLAVMVSNFASIWLFFRTLFRFGRRRALLVAGAFYAVWIASLEHPVGQLYWLTGAMEYCLSLTTLLVMASLLCRRRRGIWYFLAVALLAIVIPAQHEIAGTFLWLVLATGAVIRQIKRLPAKQWYLGLAMASLSQAVVMLSPGNRMRAIHEHKHLWDTAHLTKWIAHSFYYGINWLVAPAVLVGACCIVLLSRRGLETNAEPLPRWLAAAGICAMFLLLCLSALVETASGTWLPYRVTAWFEFLFWLLFVCVIMTGVPEIFQTRFSTGTQTGILTLLAVALFGSANFRAAVLDLHGPAQTWRRISLFRMEQHGEALSFTAPARYPNMAMPPSITADPTCWVNQCWANYLRADTVVVPNSADECPR